MCFPHMGTQTLLLLPLLTAPANRTMSCSGLDPATGENTILGCIEVRIHPLGKWPYVKKHRLPSLNTRFPLCPSWESIVLLTIVFVVNWSNLCEVIKKAMKKLLNVGKVKCQRQENLRFTSTEESDNSSWVISCKNSFTNTKMFCQLILSELYLRLESLQKLSRD